MSQRISFTSISLSLIALTLLLIGASAHAEWYPWQQEEGTTIHSVDSADGDLFVAVGDDGFIETAASLAGEWTTQTSGVAENLASIAATADRLFAVGANGTILRSLDSGVTWDKQTAPASYDYNAIYMASNNIGTVVGTQGSVVKTGNSGLTWTLVSTNTKKDLYGVTHFGNNSRAIVGADGTILISNDEGATWNSRNAGTSMSLRDIAFLNSATGFAVGDSGTIIKTVNGGGEWSPVDAPVDTENLYAIDTYEGTNILIVGDGIILFSGDAGSTWTEDAWSNEDPTFYDVQFVPSGSGFQTVAAGADAVGGFVDGFDTLPPSAPENLAVTGGSPTSDTTPTFTWDASFDETSDIDHYEIQLDDQTWESTTTSFTMPSVLANGTYTINVRAFDAALNASIATELTFEVSGDAVPVDGVTTGNLIKLSCGENTGVNDPCRAVYYYGADEKRHAFPNEKVFFTWYTGFDDVMEISSTDMANIPLGSNVTYKPGVKMVKFVSVPTVYAVFGSALLPIASENVAADLYGSDWNTKIDDIADTFYSNYIFGFEITDASQYDVQEELDYYHSIDDVI